MRRLIGGITASLVITISLSLAVSAAGSLGSWTRTTLRETEGATLQDAAFRGRAVAVVWQEPTSEIWLRTSTDSGGTFAARELVAARGRQAESTICDGRVRLAFQRRVGERWWIDTASRDVHGRGLETQTVHAANERARQPGMVCAGQRLFVAWIQEVEGTERIMVKHVVAGADFPLGDGTALGRAERDYGSSGPAMAGVSDRAYLVAAFKSTDETAPPIRLHRWSVGAGTLAPVTHLGSYVIDAGGHRPRIAAAGDTVVVAWSGTGTLEARVSHDRGATWGPTRMVEGEIADARYVPSSVAIQGSRIVLAYALEGWSFEPPFETYSTEYLASTHDDFVTSSKRKLSRQADDLIVDFVKVAGEQALAAVQDKGSRIRLLRKD